MEKKLVTGLQNLILYKYMVDLNYWVLNKKKGL